MAGNGMKGIAPVAVILIMAVAAAASVALLNMKASAWEYNPDGSINISVCGQAVDQTNKVYVMNKSLSVTATGENVPACLTIGAENITINMNGFNITGYGVCSTPGSDYETCDSDGDDWYTPTGIKSTDYNSSIIRDGIITGCYYSVYLYKSSNSTVTNMTIPDGSTYPAGNWGVGIYLYSGSNNNVTNSSISSNTYGIILIANSNSTVADIKATSNTYGIYLSSSNNSIIKNINATSNDYGVSIVSSANNVFDNFNATSGTYGFYLYTDAINNTIQNSRAASTTYGFYFRFSYNNTIKDSTAASNTNGYYLRSDSNTIKDSTAASNTYGVYFYSGAKKNTLDNLRATSNVDGAYLYESPNNIIQNSNLSYNTNNGVYMREAHNNTLRDNFIGYNSDWGIELFSSAGTHTDNNSIINNTLYENNPSPSTEGQISLGTGSNNMVINNTIVNDFGWSAVHLGGLGGNNNTLMGNNFTEIWEGEYMGGMGKVYASESNNHYLEKNYGCGAYFYISSNNTFINNTFKPQDFEFDGASSGNVLINNSIGGAAYFYGPFFNSVFANNAFSSVASFYASSLNNSFASNDFEFLFFSNSPNNTITDSICNYVLSSGTSKNNVFINTTIINTEDVRDTSQLIRKWYYQAYVNDSCGLPANTANVWAFNSTGKYQFNLTTDATGYTPMGEITDYINIGGTKAQYSPYTIIAENSSYMNATRGLITNATQSNVTYVKFTEQNLSHDPNINCSCPWVFNTDQTFDGNLYLEGSGLIQMEGNLYANSFPYYISQDPQCSVSINPSKAIG